MILPEHQLVCSSGRPSCSKMKIPFPFDFPENKLVFMRGAGYAAFVDPNTGSSSYVKRLNRDNYPRFHVYIEINANNGELINLHLDQKKPSYAGSHAHGGEYEGGAVEIEGRRLAGLIKNKTDNQKQENKTLQQSQGWFAKLFK